MPLYDYECRACAAVEEVRHGFDEKIGHACKRCGGELARKFHAAPIVFKGSGYYVTDSRKKTAAPSTSDGPKTDAPKSDAPKSDASAAADAGSKPDAPSTPAPAAKPNKDAAA